MKELYCITCPTGCKLSVLETGSILNVSGNECEMGRDFAIKELTNPTRTLTTTVRTTMPGVLVLPVRTDGEIPKGMIKEAMETLSHVVVSRELACGDTVLADLLGTGVNVIASSDILQRRELKFEARNKERLGDSMRIEVQKYYDVERDPGAVDSIGGSFFPGGQSQNDGFNEGDADGADAPAGEDTAAAGDKSEHVRKKGRAQIRS